MVGWLCFTFHRRGQLEMAPPFTVPCKGCEARFSHRNRTPGRHVAVHYTIAAQHKLL